VEENRFSSSPFLLFCSLGDLSEGGRSMHRYLVGLGALALAGVATMPLTAERDQQQPAPSSNPGGT
jgi:hypothetical protein